MIPRFAPTYTYADIFNSLVKGLFQNTDNHLLQYIEELYQCQHVFLFNRSRIALFFLLRALGNVENVIVPAYNSICVPETIIYAGCKPVFVDIADQSVNMSADKIKTMNLSGFTVVIPTHTFGIPCEMREIVKTARQNQWFILEDAAPALGAEYEGRLVGSMGDAAIISFQHHKVISSETGGILIVKDETLAKKVSELLKGINTPKDQILLFVKTLARKLATMPVVYKYVYHFYRLWKDEKMYEIVSPKLEKPKGFEKLCSPYSSALIYSQVDRLKMNLYRRRKHAEYYRKFLKDHPSITFSLIPEECSPAWNQVPIFVANKVKFYKYMQQHDVDVTWTHRYSCAESFGLDGYPNTLHAAKSVLGLPTNPWLKDEQIQYICDVIMKYKENE